MTSLPEAPFSDNFRWLDEDGLEHQTTVREATFDAFAANSATVHAWVISNGGKSPSARTVPGDAPSESSGQPVPEPRPDGEADYVPLDENGNETRPAQTFVASYLEPALTKKGEVYCKVHGGHFEKFGVVMWPEDLKACNIKLEPGKPAPDVRGWIATYSEKQKPDGKWTPSKVHSLLPPK